MAPFLSDTWLAEMGRQAERLPARPPTGADEQALSVRQVVLGGPSGDVVYDLHLTRGGLRIERTPAGTADVIFTQDLETAGRLVRGETHPQAELTAGRLQIAGPAHRLAAWRPALDALDEGLAELRSATTW